MIYWLWLSLALTSGGTSFKKLISALESPRAIYEADEEEIEDIIGSRSSDYNRLINKSLDKAEQILDFCTNKSVGLLTYSDENYPDSLKNIDNPPPVLYYRGTLPDFNNTPFISVVGTRRLSEYGKRNAFYISYDLSSAGFTIVSGMAAGIDGVSMAGALSSGGKCVGVLGTGIDVCYPKEHLFLAREIVKNGCIITEFPPKTPPYKTNFPIRNRIISGLSSGTVVIEGGIKSGSIITARRAKEQGKDVFALPGNVGNKTSEVTNLLIKNGAFLITDASDIITKYEFKYPGKITPFNMQNNHRVNADEYLSSMKVSCVCLNDSVFSRNRRNSSNEEVNPHIIKQNKKTENTNNLPDLSGLDALSRRIIDSIPENGEIQIDDLLSVGINVSDLMKKSLKLEMLGFITMLPGEKIKRNF